MVIDLSSVVGCFVDRDGMGNYEMTFNEYQELTKRTMKNRTKNEFLLGLAGEVGEFLEVVKKETYQGHPESEDKKKLELGDVLRYLTGLCNLYGYSLEEIATLNIIKTNVRYPDGFSEEASINRKDVK